MKLIEKDTVFVVMSKHLDIKIWSSDKILVDGLRKKGFEAIILTAELLEILHQN
jgi:predicted nucleic acid-binding protein